MLSIDSIIPRHRGTFAANVLTIMLGTALAQALAVLFSPVITRIYDPANLGALAVFTSLSSWLGVVSAGRYEMAIMLPEDEQEAAHLFLLSLIITIVSGALILLVIFLSGHQIARIFSGSDMVRWLYYLSPAVVMTGFIQTANIWYGRHKTFKRISQAKVALSGVMVGTQVSAGYYLGPGAGKLIGGFLFGYAISSIVLLWRIPFRWASIKRNELGQNLARMARRYRRFPIYTSWAALLNVGTYKLPMLLMAALFDSRVAGLYALAVIVISSPVTLISGSISQVFFQKASEQIRQQGDAAVLIKRLVVRLFCVGLLPCVFLALFGRPLFALIFGRAWIESGLFIQIMTPLYLAMLIVAPISTIFSAMEKQHLALLWQGIYFAISLVSFMLARLFDNYLLGVILFSTLGTFRYLGMLVCILKINKGELGNSFQKQGELL